MSLMAQEQTNPDAQRPAPAQVDASAGNGRPAPAAHPARTLSPRRGRARSQPSARVQEALDGHDALELQYYESDFTRPLVETIADQVIAATPAGGRVLLVAPAPLLAHTLADAGFALALWSLEGQRVPDDLRAAAAPALPLTDLLDALLGAPPQEPWDTIVLPRLLEALPVGANGPTLLLHALRKMLVKGGTLVLATTNLIKFGTRKRALLGQEFQPSPLNAPAALPGDWPALPARRFYTLGELRLLASAAGFGVRRAALTPDRRPFFTLAPRTPVRWARGWARHALLNARRGWRDTLVVTLAALPRFELPGYAQQVERLRGPAATNLVPGEEGAPYWRPFVSVVMPTHNRAELLRSALVDGLFVQNYPADRWEIVLVNDGSRDHTPQVIEEVSTLSPVPIRVFTLEGRGATAARNYGMQQARGAVVAHIDDDGRAAPGWLEAGINAFRPGVALVAGPILPDLDQPHGFFTYVPRMESDQGLFPTANLFMRTDLALENGGFDESFGKNVLGRPAPGWDSDLAYRILRQGYRHVWCEEAVAVSALFPLTVKQWFQETSKFRYQAGIIRRVPETRRGLAPLGGVVAEGRKRLYWLLSLLGLLLWPRYGARMLLLSLPWLARMARLFRGELASPRRAPRAVAKMALSWLWYLASFVFIIYGALRARRLIL